MKMLRYFGLAVLVVCIAAFASGCGGGGGGGSATTPVMECPQEQVGTYPDCMEPGPTDEERIAEARNTLAGIVSNARNLAQTASSTAAAVQTHEDATADQIASALAHAGDAQAALAGVEGASSAGNAATTPAAAEMAVADANAALSRLRSAQSAVAAVQSAVNAVAEARRQREADVIALTNNSSLIKHVRENKLLADAVLGAVTADSIVVGSAMVTTINNDKTETCTAPCATFPGNTGTGADRVTGQRTVVVQGLTSDSTTPSLTGTGRLPHGFDLKNADGSTFVNAYTDITQTRLNVRTRTNVVEDTDLSDGDDRYTEMDFRDTDYLLAGIWLTVGANFGASTISAFAYGSQPIATTAQTFCSGIEASGANGSTTRNCATTTVNTIDAIVDDGKDVKATYSGNANGAYLAGGDTSYFTADVTLNAEFRNPTGTATNTGSIQGEVTNITAGGQSIDGSIELQKQNLVDDINPAFAAGTAVGVVDGKSYGGDWKGQFFGHRVTRSQTTNTDRTDPTNIQTTITTTYSPQAPGSVAGTFYVKQQSNPAGSTAFIGSFGAHR